MAAKFVDRQEQTLVLERSTFSLLSQSVESYNVCFTDFNFVVDVKRNGPVAHELAQQQGEISESENQHESRPSKAASSAEPDSNSQSITASIVVVGDDLQEVVKADAGRQDDDLQKVASEDGKANSGGHVARLNLDITPRFIKKVCISKQFVSRVLINCPEAEHLFVSKLHVVPDLKLFSKRIKTNIDIPNVPAATKKSPGVGEKETASLLGKHSKEKGPSSVEAKSSKTVKISRGKETTSSSAKAVPEKKKVPERVLSKQEILFSSDIMKEVEVATVNVGPPASPGSRSDVKGSTKLVFDIKQGQSAYTTEPFETVDAVDSAKPTNRPDAAAVSDPAYGNALISKDSVGKDAVSQKSDITSSGDFVLVPSSPEKTDPKSGTDNVVTPEPNASPDSSDSFVFVSKPDESETTDFKLDIPNLPTGVRGVPDGSDSVSLLSPESSLLSPGSSGYWSTTQSTTESSMDLKEFTNSEDSSVDPARSVPGNSDSLENIQDIHNFEIPREDSGSRNSTDASNTGGATDASNTEARTDALDTKTKKGSGDSTEDSKSSNSTDASNTDSTTDASNTDSTTDASDAKTKQGSVDWEMKGPPRGTSADASNEDSSVDPEHSVSGNRDSRENTEDTDSSNTEATTDASNTKTKQGSYEDSSVDPSNSVSDNTDSREDTRNFDVPTGDSRAQSADAKQGSGDWETKGRPRGKPEDASGDDSSVDPANSVSDSTDSREDTRNFDIPTGDSRAQSADAKQGSGDWETKDPPHGKPEDASGEDSSVDPANLVSDNTDSREDTRNFDVPTGDSRAHNIRSSDAKKRSTDDSDSKTKKGAEDWKTERRSQGEPPKASQESSTASRKRGGNAPQESKAATSERDGGGTSGLKAPSREAAPGDFASTETKVWGATGYVSDEERASDDNSALEESGYSSISDSRTESTTLWYRLVFWMKKMFVRVKVGVWQFIGERGTYRVFIRFLADPQRNTDRLFDALLLWFAAFPIPGQADDCLFANNLQGNLLLTSLCLPLVPVTCGLLFHASTNQQPGRRGHGQGRFRILCAATMSVAGGVYLCAGELGYRMCLSHSCQPLFGLMTLFWSASRITPLLM